jgi:hypothetical protein
MTARAFIVSRPQDYPLACRCAESLYWQGWRPAIMLDAREWTEVPTGAVLADYWTEGRGMFGNDCAEAILAGVLAHSRPGDIVAKFDCDIRLTDAGAEWLMASAARAFRIGPQAWGGCWSAPREQVVEAAEKLRTMPRCKCPESGLILDAFRRTQGRLTSYPAMTAAKWLPGRPWPATASAITLPASYGECTMPRRVCGAALFDFRP